MTRAECPATVAAAPSNEPAVRGRRRAQRPQEPSATAGSFDAIVLPHLDAAYRLARWLLRNEHNAQDAVQEACLRALRYFHTFTGGNARAWFLRIVRHECWQSRTPALASRMDEFDETRHGTDRRSPDPEAQLMRVDDVLLIERALVRLPAHFRELLVLRELEDLSYRELADVLGIPIGTVMSGLSRSRQAFRAALDVEQRTGAIRAGGHAAASGDHESSA
jgi:RNA polymerase sigma-70 factor (ECF subfamily)